MTEEQYKIHENSKVLQNLGKFRRGHLGADPGCSEAENGERIPLKAGELWEDIRKKKEEDCVEKESKPQVLWKSWKNAVKEKLRQELFKMNREAEAD